MRTEYDDLDAAVRLPDRVSRVVCLVPSLTEAVASVDRTALVGVTDWCTHPADLDVTRVRGTKNPDLAAISALRPDVVIATKEENRELDVRRLREAGVSVWVTDIESVPDAIASMERLFDVVLRWPRPDWLSRSRALWCGDLPPVRATTATAIWRDPWMVVGRDTFTGDLLARVGLPNVFADHAERYPRVTVSDIEGRRPGVVLLPDEPYEFGPADGPEAFRLPTHLLEGRLITWYGPSLLEAYETLSECRPGT